MKAILRNPDRVVELPGRRRVKDVLNRLEQLAPGTKHNFLFGFYEKGREYFVEADTGRDLMECARCGMPTTQPVCAFCLMMELATIV